MVVLLCTAGALYGCMKPFNRTYQGDLDTGGVWFSGCLAVSQVMAAGSIPVDEGIHSCANFSPAWDAGGGFQIASRSDRYYGTAI